MEFDRRSFLRGAGAISVGGSAPWAKSETAEPSNAKEAISKIRVAQIKVFPEKGNIKTNHDKLMTVLADVAKSSDIDVIVTPEGFLDGYVSTEKSVAKEDMIKYAISA